MLALPQQWCHQVALAAKAVSDATPGTSLTQALAVGTVVGVLAYRFLKSSRYRLPPGPTPLPLLGNLLWLNSKEEQFYTTVARWAKEKYGPVISVYFGPILCIFVNDFDTLNEALVQKGTDFAGRPYLHSLHLLTEGSKDIAFADYSPTWKLHRKIAAKALRHYMTGSHLDKVVHEVMAKVLDRMAAEPGAFDPHPYTSKLMFHIIDYICFGESKPFDDPAIQVLVDNELNKEVGNGFFEDIIPLLKYWPTKSFRKAISANSKYLDYIEENIQKHRQRFNPSDVQDIADSILLAQMEAEKEESAEALAMITDVHVRQTIFDLFAAGVDTSRFTLNWALLYMAGNPQAQKRAQAEIDAATGTEMPGVGHRARLPYTQAVMQETMRMSPVVPLSLPHKSVCNTTVGGYDVPKDTMVMMNIWAVTHDPKLWDQPDEFRPERFLDDEGQLKALPKAWLPFSAGRRMCLGESVAKPELLLLLACFLKRFSISLPEGATYDPSGVVEGMTALMPKPYQMTVTGR